MKQKKIYCKNCKNFDEEAIGNFKNTNEKCKKRNSQSYEGVGQDYFNAEKWYGFNCQDFKR